MSNRSLRKQRKQSNQLEAAILRSANGRATPRDVDMLERFKAEARGKNGYTGETKGSAHSAYNGYGYEGYQFSQSTQSKPFTQFHVNQGKKDEHVFHCADSKEITDRCPLNPPVPDIYVEQMMWQTWMNMAKAVNTEWIALLKGKMGKDSHGEDAYVIESYYLPPQTASGSHVDVPTGWMPRPGTIGAVHSHVDMGVFFSGTDMAHSNWPVEIVINRRESYEAVARFKLKCGEYSKAKSKVYLQGSVIGPRVKEAIEQAFAEGLRLSRSKAALSSPSTNVAIVKTIDEEEPTVNSDPITCYCGHDILIHYKNNGDVNGCQLEDCDCIKFTRPLVQDRECQCGHMEGRHYLTKLTMNPYRTYCIDKACRCSTFTVKVKVEDKEPKGEVQTSIAFPTLGTTMGISDNPETAEWSEALLITEQSDNPNDLPSEEYCEPCEGTGFVESRPNVATVCSSCKGDGLSDIGRVRKAETDKVN